jgi:Zn-dependent alcohol dehydrogenase
MFVDTDAIRALGAACCGHAADLSAAAAALTSLPGPDATAAFGPVGAGFLAALDDAVTAEAQAIAALSADFASGHTAAFGAAAAYADAERRGSRLL